MQKIGNGITTIYPSHLYELTATNTTKHIYGNNLLLATIKSDTPAPKLYHNHLDHLDSTKAVTTPDGYLNQELEYYPFGQTRLDNQYGDLTQSNQYIGQNFDQETDLSYLNARYYDRGRGQFLSQDPSFLDIGGPGFEQNYQRTLQQHLMNPQALNSYSYALNNPIRYSDPEGEIVPLLIGAWALAEIGLSAYDGYTAYQTVNDPNVSELEKSVALGGFAAGLAASGGGYGSGGKFLLNVADKSVTARQIGQVSSRISSGHAYSKHIDQFADLGISTKGEFNKHVSNVMKNPSISAKLEGGRSVFYDGKSNTAVFVDPKNKDWGTAFRPAKGESYVKNIIKNQKRK